MQSGRFLSKLLSKLAGPLMKVALPLAKNTLAPLGFIAAMSAIDGSIQKKIHGSGATKGAGVKLIIGQEDMNDIIKIIKALENSGILLKGVSKAIKNETKEQKGGFLSMLLGTLGASLLGNLLSGGKGIMRAAEGIVRAGEGSYFDSFGIEHIPKEINKFINNGTTKSSCLKRTADPSALARIKSNIFRIQAYDSIMCGYFCIEFINYMLKGKTLLDYTNLFSPNDFKKNDRVIKRIFKNE